MMRGIGLYSAVAGGLLCAASVNSQTNQMKDAQPPARSQVAKPIAWPNGKRAAVSLSFDDARLSQIDTGLVLLKKLDVKVTFFVVPSGVQKRLAGWRQAVADGHEIANHSLTHPCTVNYGLSGNDTDVLENYDLNKMAHQLDGANEQIQKLLGVKPVDFAYPCGLKFVGRGVDVRSYVPLVAERFLVGRGYLDEAANKPADFDFGQAMGTVFDDQDFSEMKKVIDEATKDGRWVIFVGHEIGERAYQTTDTKALEALCAYLKDPANGIWLGTVQEIGSYVKKQRVSSE